MTAGHKASSHRSGRRIALVDSDALQRACTGNSLAALGADCTSFGRVSDLVAAIRAGTRFDALVVGLHADAVATVSGLREADKAAGAAIPVLHLAHQSELDAVLQLPARLLARTSFRLLLSPVDEAELMAWLNAPGLEKKAPQRRRLSALRPDQPAASAASMSRAMEAGVSSGA